MSARGIAPPLAPADLLERVARALERAPAGRLTVLSLPAPPIDPLALLETGDDAFAWTDRAGRMTCARGSIVRLAAEGPTRFAQLVAASHALRQRVHIVHEDGDGAPPRLVGGAAFASGGAADPDWRGFEDGSFDLPRIAWIDDAARGCRLQLALADRADGAERHHLLDGLESLLNGATAGARSDVELRGDVGADAERAGWDTQMGAALDVIESGGATKIVCARRVRLEAAHAPVAATLARSLGAAEGSFRFVIRRGDIVFAGATPERLVEREGEHVRTEAVAGTAELANGIALDEREKDRREHLAVVLAIEEALAPVCLALEHAEEPVVRSHGHVSHLVTPFDGRVDAALHVLELVDRLHPTPAVAGAPRDVALEFIARNERTPRGWYAGPVGWFDLSGQGELAVALRCARIEGTTVDAYAGAGIVRGSDAAAEFEETVLKMRAALGALGAAAVP